MTDPQPAVPREGSFRAWVNDLGYVRRDGWVGGVASGIARRIGVDPMIVRGAFVVTALIGFPALWVYAFVWAALPDADGRTVFNRGRGGARVGLLLTAVLAGIGTVATVVAFGVLLDASVMYGMTANIIPILTWAGFLVATIAVLVWSARRTPAHIDSPLIEGARGEAVGADATGGAAPGAAPPSSPGEAPTPPDGSGDMAAWREQYAAWRRQHDEWRLALAAQEQDPRAAERAMRREQQAAFRAESARVRAERRAARPRTSLAYIGVAVGLALLAGGATGVAVISGHGIETAVTAGAFAGSFALAAAMVTAGFLRRRSGFLALLTIAALLLGGSGLGRAALDDFVLPGATRYPGAVPLTIDQPFGTLFLEVGPWDGGDGVTTVTKGSGDTYVIVAPDVDVDVRVHTDDGGVSIMRWVQGRGETERVLDARPDGAYRWVVDAEDERATRTIEIAQNSGYVYIHVQER
ncbi:PspC domain-containing protein [Microbacterium karelineae]|uniref:PspC domain-containing protein n=1 Tax=Microbacterium karelineae TaxID=2654283 RepID=UPI0012EAB306|nr:PspC domain-containing protein [Microbacterium karelineae]